MHGDNMNGKWIVFIQPFSNQLPIKALYNYCKHSPAQVYIQTPMTVSAMQETDSSSRAVRVWCLAQGHLGTQLGVGVGIAKEVTIRFVSRFTCHDAILSRCIAILELLRCIAMHCEFSLNTVKKKLSHYQWLTGCV